MRRRKLPAEHVVWLVIRMGLFRDRSIAQVVHHLALVRPTPGGDRRRVTNAAIVQAREQLGAAPLAALFQQTAQAWAPAAAAADRWRGLAVYGLDCLVQRKRLNHEWCVRPPSGALARRISSQHYFPTLAEAQAVLGAGHAQAS